MYGGKLGILHTPIHSFVFAINNEMNSIWPNDCQSTVFFYFNIVRINKSFVSRMKVNYRWRNSTQGLAPRACNNYTYHSTMKEDATQVLYGTSADYC